MPHSSLEQRKGSAAVFMLGISIIAVAGGVYAGRNYAMGEYRLLVFLMILLFCLSAASVVLYKKYIASSYRRLEDANLELHLEQEELLDIKDDLFIKFLGVYDVNYAANSPRLFADRLTDVADITARVMEADACFIYLYDKKKDDLLLAASNGVQVEAIGKVRIPLGEGVEGWVGRRLEPITLKDYRADTRFREIAGLSLAEYTSVYCLPLYVYSNGALMGVMETFYRTAKTFSDEEINFFTTLSGILSTTIQNEQMQNELRKMNMELEQWVAEKTEELRASEERYRTLVENACESIFLISENGDVVFANEHAAKLTLNAKYDLLHMNLFDFFVDPQILSDIIGRSEKEHQVIRQGEFKQSDGTIMPVSVSAVRLSLMGRRFIQAVIRDISSQVDLERLLKEKEKELAELRAHLKKPS